MVNSDSESKETEISVTRPRRLPEIVDINIQRVEYSPPDRRFIRSAFSEYNQAIEFVVTYEGEYPRSQALAPVLFVGESIVSESEMLDDNQVRFLAFDERRLEPGAPISFGWPNDPEQRQVTQYHFNLESE